MDISVLILARDRADDLPQAVASVIAQTTNRRLDVVIAHIGDDAAPAAVAREYERRYDRPTSKLRFAFVTGDSPPAALNSALLRTDTPYVAFLRAEDRWDRFKLERQLTAIHVGRHAGLVHTGWITAANDHDQEDDVHDEDANDVPPRERASTQNGEQQGHCVGRCLDTLLAGCSMPMSTVLVRRTVLNEATVAGLATRWFDENAGDAWFDDLLLRFARRTQFVLVSEPLTVVHADSMEMKAFSMNALRDSVAARLAFMDELDGQPIIDRGLVREHLSKHLLNHVRAAAGEGRHGEAEQVIAVADELGLRDERFTLPEKQQIAAQTPPPRDEESADEGHIAVAAADKAGETVMDDDAAAMDVFDELMGVGDRPANPLAARANDDDLADADHARPRKESPRSESGVYDSAPMAPPHTLSTDTSPKPYTPPPRKPPSRGLFQRLRDWLLRLIGGSF